MRCPKCRVGKMFPEGTLYSAQFMKMNKNCSTCGQSFMPEPGYYFGAMFVSYALNTALFVAVWLALTIFVEEISTAMIVISIMIAVIAFLPITFRMSRVLWIYIFIRYNSTKKNSG
jgi:hypothetical protein